MSGHGESHGPETDEANLHGPPFGIERPSELNDLGVESALDQANCGSHSAVPARSSSTMASVRARSPRPANGSSAKALDATLRSPVSAASTVISWTATWRRSNSA